jgi:hypothetical protein
MHLYSNLAIYSKWSQHYIILLYTLLKDRSVCNLKRLYYINAKIEAKILQQ